MLPSSYKMKRLYEMRQMLRLKLETTDVGGNQPKTDKSMSLKGGQEVALRRSYPTKCCYTDEWVIRKREMCAGRDTGRICQRGPKPCIYNVPEFYSAGPIACTRSIMDIWIKIPDSKGGTILFRGTNIGSASVDKSQLQISTSMRHTEHMAPANQRDSYSRLGQRICSTAPSLQRRLSYGKLMSFRSYTTDGKGSKSSDENVLNQKVQSEKPADAHKDAVNTRNPFQDGTPWERRLYSIMKVPNVRKVQDLFALITKHEDLWEAAYKRLARNEGSMTPGTDGGTIDGVSKQLLNALRISVKDGKYKFGEVKRVFIPKGSGRLRPLGIPTFQDRLVQEVIRIALEACYEPIFSPNSHGFRPRKSQHTCLRQVRRDFSGVNWVIEGDLSKCFDTINHKILIKLLRQRIEDHKFVNLIEKNLKTLTVLPTGEKEKGIAGTPQGGIVSPLLSNICLNELDKFVKRLQRIINRGKGRREKKEYSRVIAALSRNRAKKKKIEDTVGRQNVPIALTKEISRLAKEGRSITRKGGTKDPNDPNFRRLVYVRYADDFIIGMAGPKKLAERVKSLISRFLKQKLSLTLSSEKTHITALRENRVPFLGYNIGKHLGLKVVKKKKGTALKVRATLSSKSIMLLADTPKVIRKLKEKGFCDGNGVPKPNFVFAYQHPQSWTISRAASFIRGITNYYHLADNKRGLVSRIVYIIRSSIAKTWAAKFKLGNQKAVMKIAGRDLRRMSLYKRRGEKVPIGATDSKLVRVGTEAGSKINISVKKLPYLPFTKYRDITPPDKRAASKEQSQTSAERVLMGDETHITDPIRKLVTLAIRGRMMLSQTCASCGIGEGVEMHHVRALKDLKGRNFVEKQMIAANRKQIPLCRSCHAEAHSPDHKPR
jgi:group II intron reverse transcriptase/maturase